MLPKKRKSIEEKATEEFFPIDEDNLKTTTNKLQKENIVRKDYLRNAVEKQVKGTILSTKTVVEKYNKKPNKSDLEIVEKTSNKSQNKLSKTRKKTSKSSKSRARKKSTYSRTKNETFTPEKISLKKDGYELIITEKPQAANKIANALGKAKTQYNPNKVSYFELERNGKKIIVACAVGHLFTLKQNNRGSEIPIFDISWFPNYLVRKKDFTKRYYDTLLKLSKNAGSVTVATDFDIEGEVIGLNAVRFITGQSDANRMKFSTLTPQELNDAYEKKSPHLDWGQAIAGETRHYLDWFYGINLSRALMNAIKTTGKFKLLSIGRVQGPALNLIVNKEKEIQAFKSQPYWQIFIKVDDKKNKLELKYNKDIFNKDELKEFDNLKGKTAIAETRKTEQIIPPQPPFNLTTLQVEAYKFHGITPSNTLRAAQSLYLGGLISYPRTSSQKLPKEIGYKEILKKIAKDYKVEHLIKRNTPIEGKKSDSAHPSIYPTGNKNILSGDEEKIYNLIVRRFLSLFCEDAIIDNKTVKATVDEKIFSTRGSQIRKKAWLEIYPSKQKEIEIPDMNGEVKIIDSKIEEKETQPPKRYSPASIVSQLEKRNLGTKATRSSILETLYDRGYIKEKSIEATSLGISLIETLEKYSPIIIDEALTRKFEQQMESITKAKSGFLDKENKIIDSAKKTITDIAKDFEKNKNKIGKELVQATDSLRAQQKIENTITQCPKCKKGNLAITYSKKTRRHFVACDAYPECKNTFSLPPNGIIKIIKPEKLCEKCGFPMLMRLSKGKRPWIFCFNPECPTNKERIDEYNKKKEAEENN